MESTYRQGPSANSLAAVRSRSRSQRSGRRASIVAFGCAAALAIAGCGGGSDDESTTSSDDFVAQVNGICKQHADPIRAAASKLLAGGQLPQPSQFQKLAGETIIPEYQAQIGELEPLTAPEDVADAYGEWLTNSQATLEQMMKDPAIITDPASFTDVNEEADQLGLSTDCHVGPS